MDPDVSTVTRSGGSRGDWEAAGGVEGEQRQSGALAAASELEDLTAAEEIVHPMMEESKEREVSISWAWLEVVNEAEESAGRPGPLRKSVEPAVHADLQASSHVRVIMSLIESATDNLLNLIIKTDYVEAEDITESIRTIKALLLEADWQITDEGIKRLLKKLKLVIYEVEDIMDKLLYNFIKNTVRYLDSSLKVRKKLEEYQTVDSRLKQRRKLEEYQTGVYPLLISFKKIQMINLLRNVFYAIANGLKPTRHSKVLDITTLISTQPRISFNKKTSQCHRTMATSSAPLDLVRILGGHQEVYCNMLRSLLVGTSAEPHNTTERGMRCLNMIEYLQYILQDKSTTSAMLKDWTEKHLRLTSQTCIGRDGDKEKIINWLLSDSSSDFSTIDGGSMSNLSVMSIVGETGVGKTTLAKLVYADPSICAHFSARGWIHVVDNLDGGWLSKALFSSITGKPSGGNEPSHFQTILRQELTGKRLLLVLDDIYVLNPRLLEGLQIPLSEVKICKIILTIHYAGYASISRNPSFYHLGRLPPNLSWDLFCHSALYINPNINGRLIAIGKELIDKCEGIPLAVKILGSLLSYLSSEQTLSNVLEIEAWKLEAKGTGVMSILQLCYYLMPSHLKQCFLYCSMFPKGYKFDKYELVSLWMAQNYIEPKDSMRVEDIAYDYFFQLQRLSFFDESWDGRFLMHGFLHDLAKSISKGEYCASEEHQIIGISEEVRHLHVTGKQFYLLDKPEAMHTFLYRNLDIRPPKNFSSSLEKMRQLRVLELKGHGSSSVMEMETTNHIKKLSIYGRLNNLRYLKICDESIVRLPASICLLYNLEMMILDRCVNLNELPRDIGKLLMLRYLGLSETRIEMLPDSICLLFNLQSLVMNYCRNLSELPEGIEKLENLKYVGLCGTRIEKLPGSICCLSKLPILKLDYCKRLLELPDRIEGLVNLQFIGITHTKINRLPESVCRLSNLLILDMASSNLLELPDNIGNLSNLYYLGLSHTNISFLPESMCQLSGLQTLKLNGCRNLSHLPSGIGALINLKHLVLSGTSIEDLPESLCQLSNLETLEMDGCRRLSNLPWGIGSLTMLHQLKLSDVEIAELPVSMCQLSNLQILQLNGCCKLSQLPDDIGKLSNLTELVITETKIWELPQSLCQLSKLRKLNLNGNSNLQELTSCIGNLTSLCHLELSDVGIQVLPKQIGELEKLETLIFQSSEKLVESYL